ncbi:DUF500-domain-containing protein [Lichtheimia hyalospora FSU 10163]|nr:DUF500-domain-containing protein [Lichtheimia hyalospora FSU 10163]
MKKVKNAASSININSPIPTSLAGECKKAARILNSFIDPGQKLVDKVIPPTILDNAQGLAIFTVLKAGFLFSGRAGSGLVVARLVCSFCYCYWWYGCWWSDWCRIDRFRACVEYQGSLAAGPMGRNAEASGTASLKHISAVYSYSKTKGLFAGVSLEGSVILTRNDANEKLYGQRVTAKELLNGSVAPPPEADMLYRALNAKFHTLGNTGAMYARNSAEGSPRAYNFKSSNISAPGTIRQPPPLRNPPSAPAPTSSYNNQPPPPYTAPPTTNNNYYGQEKSNYHHQPPPPQPATYATPSPPVATSRAPPPPPPPFRKPQQPTARALYDFTGEQDGDLSFREGEVITIVEKSDSQDDWWTGIAGGKQGIFPANYVQLQ